MANIDRQILSTYFAFTTLSSVGLGDFVPISDNERIATVFILLFGVTVYSFIGENFNRMILHLKEFDKDFE
mgnify:CR=1 FL=1